jgi:tetratricopeptide (TPR) repeat protein
MASSSLASGGNGDGESVCYLCLGGDLDDDDGQPLRRDCACRGTDAGFVHLSCLTDYAATKSKQASEMNQFRKPWRVCPSCNQFYQNEFAIDIAAEFVSFVRRQYPDNTQKQVEALHTKLYALGFMFERLLPRQKREAGITANVLLSLIDRMKGEVSPLPRRYSLFESYAYSVRGRIALDEGTEESARRAVAHFEKALKVREAIGDAEDIANAKSNLAYAKSMYVSGNNDEEVLKASRELYEMRIAKLGEEHENTIIAGKNYALRLRKANRREEARDLLMKLLAMSKQVLGPHHNTTKEVESVLKEVINAGNQEL